MQMTHPAWLKLPTRDYAPSERMARVLGECGVHTVCVNADCPNAGECFARGTCTFMILGEICTRRCGFCAVHRGTPAPPDPGEPARVAHAARVLGLRHVVVTSVTRDDLADGGARALRGDRPRAAPASGRDRRGPGARFRRRPRCSRAGARRWAGRACPQHRDGAASVRRRAPRGCLRAFARAHRALGAERRRLEVWTHARPGGDPAGGPRGAYGSPRRGLRRGDAGPVPATFERPPARRGLRGTGDFCRLATAGVGHGL